MKRCSACGQEKYLSEFGKDSNRRNSKDGLQRRCKQCCRSYLNKWLSDHPDNKRKYRAQHAPSRATIRNNRYASDPVYAAAQRAKSSISGSTGISVRLIPIEIAEAKAAQLLVHRFVTKGK